MPRSIPKSRMNLTQQPNRLSWFGIQTIPAMGQQRHPLGEAGLEPACENPLNPGTIGQLAEASGAESGAVTASGAVEGMSAPLTLMIREFRDALPAERIKLASVWGIRPGSPAAAALGIPTTDADATDVSP